MRTSETPKDYNADSDPIAQAMNGIWIIIFIPYLAKPGKFVYKCIRSPQKLNK